MYNIDIYTKEQLGVFYTVLMQSQMQVKEITEYDKEYIEHTMSCFHDWVSTREVYDLENFDQIKEDMIKHIHGCFM